MTYRAATATALGLAGLLCLGIFGTHDTPEPQTVANASIGLPVPAWITPNGSLKVYVGIGPNRRLLVNRSADLNIEHCYWTRNVVDAEGFAILPIGDTPRVQVREERADGTFADVVPPVNVADMARGR